MGLLIFLCLPSVIDNKTITWTQQDQDAFERATMRCRQIDPEFPCLKQFIKLDEHRYMAVCKKDD